jgi:hypothetical protein
VYNLQKEGNEPFPAMGTAIVQLESLTVQLDKCILDADRCFTIKYFHQSRHEYSFRYKYYKDTLFNRIVDDIYHNVSCACAHVVMFVKCTEFYAPEEWHIKIEPSVCLSVRPSVPLYTYRQWWSCPLWNFSMHERIFIFLSYMK